jgi:hypothetical protein
VEWKPHALPRVAEALQLAAVNYTFSKNCQKNLGDLFRYRENAVRSLLSQLTAWRLYMYCKWGGGEVMLIYIRYDRWADLERICPGATLYQVVPRAGHLVTPVPVFGFDVDVVWSQALSSTFRRSSCSYACAGFWFRCWRRMIAGFIVDVSEEQLFHSSWSVLIGMMMQSCSVGKLSLAPTGLLEVSGPSLANVVV